MIAADYITAAFIVATLIVVGAILRIKPSKQRHRGWIQGSLSD